MTLIIGLKCKNGLVLAADSMTTESAPQGNGYLTKHEAEKLTIQKDIIWGTSGSVGVRQIVQELIESKYNEIFKPAYTAVTIRQNLVSKIHPVLTQQYKYAADASLGRGPFPHTNFVFGVCCQGGFHLINIECDLSGEVVISPHFCTGSGAKTGQALLRRLRNQEWDVRTGEVIAYRTMNDAIHVEPMGIGPPIRLARFTRGANNVPKAEMITGVEYETIRDTAMAWTKTEQEVLEEMQGQQANPGAVPSASSAPAAAPPAVPAHV